MKTNRHICFAKHNMYIFSSESSASVPVLIKANTALRHCCVAIPTLDNLCDHQINSQCK